MNLALEWVVLLQKLNKTYIISKKTHNLTCKTFHSYLFQKLEETEHNYHEYIFTGKNVSKGEQTVISTGEILCIHSHILESFYFVT